MEVLPLKKGLLSSITALPVTCKHQQISNVKKKNNTTKSIIINHTEFLWFKTESHLAASRHNVLGETSSSFPSSPALKIQFKTFHPNYFPFSQHR